MSVETIKVAVLGAAGENAGLILDGLLASKKPKFEITALARPSSVSKPSYIKLATKGIRIITVDLDGPDIHIVEALEGQDIVIASVPPNALDSQLPLIRAAKLANIKRFVPSAFAMAIAPSGICGVQIEKERIYAELVASSIPYTIIDVGWWYNGFIPQVPSGITDFAIALPEFIRNLVPGDGTIKTHVIDNEDVGRLVARIITDPRTINKRVMASGTALSFDDMFAIAEELTGEKPEPRNVSAEGLKNMIAGLNAKLESSPDDYFLFVGKSWLEYYYSSFIDCDNSPDGIKRLGYVSSTELYPDFVPTSFRTFLQETMEKNRRLPYSDRA
ncbi:unnamed protein product [Clonostachys rhizophaga]|uniref:NmrA-like domain-containing protein n=1 Tax=Clonostachys rhizophaga TaxID=160324 RepID=A0A9N9YDD6_9HYPO|nr:unnamed protein product [Clonostachys rhizophaga]